MELGCWLISQIHHYFQVEQLHKILKLCGSPSEDYWRKTKSPRATSFKPQVQYKRRVTEKFKDVPSTALSLIEKLLSLEPRDRGTAANALRSEVISLSPKSSLSLYMYIRSDYSCVVIHLKLITFLFQFFSTKPLPCAPSSLPKFPPSKEFDIKLRDEEAKR